MYRHPIASSRRKKYQARKSMIVRDMERKKERKRARERKKKRAEREKAEIENRIHESK